MSRFPLKDLIAIDKIKDKEKRIAELRKCGQNKAFTDFLDITYNPNIQWILPEGLPPYEKLNESSQYSVTLKEVTRLFAFTSLQNKKSTLSLEMKYMDNYAKSIPIPEFDVLESARNKRKLPFKTLKVTDIKDAFPWLAELWKKK